MRRKVYITLTFSNIHKMPA